MYSVFFKKKKEEEEEKAVNINLGIAKCSLGFWNEGEKYRTQKLRKSAIQWKIFSGGEFPWLLAVDGEGEMTGIGGQSLCTSLALIHEPWPMIMRPQNPNIHRFKWPKQTLPKICE